MFTCRNCRGQKARPLYPEVRDRFHGYDGTFSYVTCQGCGLAQLEEVPEDLGRYYASYRVHTGDSAVYHRLRKLMIGHCYLQADGGGRSLLDFGCGNGWYLQEMAERGWRAVGYEVDPSYASDLSTRLGLPVISGAEALRERAGAFDLITLNFAFEHLGDPLAVLASLIPCLRAGGQIYLTVPNIESREAKLFGDKWFHLDPPRHVSFFTKRLLGEALESHGLTNVETRDLPLATGLAGSMSYKLWDRFVPATWYSLIVPGFLFSAVVRDGNFAISARKASG